MIHCIMLINRQGKIRLIKWYECSGIQDRIKYMRDIAVTVIGRSSRLCNFLEWGEYKIVYKRYASFLIIIKHIILLKKLLLVDLFKKVIKKVF